MALQQLLELREPGPGEEEGQLSPNNPYACPVCGRSFRSPSYLRFHMRSHTGKLLWLDFQKGKMPLFLAFLVFPIFLRFCFRVQTLIILPFYPRFGYPRFGIPVLNSK